MTSGMQEAERRCLDISKQVDAAVGVRLDTERQLREQTNATITRLQDTVSESHKETVRVVSDCQSTSIEHAEVLRRLEQELLAFKLDTETKLTEEARKLSGVVVDQRKIGEGVELAAADSTLTRLKEVEHALLKEREMRKTLEHEVAACHARPRCEPSRCPQPSRLTVLRTVSPRPSRPVGRWWRCAASAVRRRRWSTRPCTRACSRTVAAPRRSRRRSRSAAA